VAIHFLAQQNDYFRGSFDKLYTDKNGKFLELIEMMEKYDAIISEHVRRIKCKETFDHYLGPEIQKELVNLMAYDIHKKKNEFGAECKILFCVDRLLARYKSQGTIIYYVVNHA